LKLPIKVVPSSSRDCIAGWLGEALKVRVTAPAERGKANAAAERLVADALGASRQCVRIVAGQASVRKVIEIHGFSEPEVYARLAKSVT
jgi:uncharacterized protein (TIGR00251 family)